MTITPAQCRAARALLDWKQVELAEYSGASLRVVRGFETGSQGVAEKSISKLREAFEAKGLAFIGANKLTGVVRREP